MRNLLFCALTFIVACADAHGRIPTNLASSAPATPAAPLPSAAPVTLANAAPNVQHDAAVIMLAMINDSRKAAGLTAVALDEDAGFRAALRHARDMASNGFLGHWGTDGSVPEQRYSEAGGVHMVLENALCITDEKRRAIEENASITRADIEQAEHMFFDELPPNDGHRLNILKPQHTHVAIAFALAKAGPGETVFPCIVQEFTDHHGTYGALPGEGSPGQVLHVTASLEAGATPFAVGIARLPVPSPLTAAVANTRRSYPVPVPDETFWPKGFKTRLEVSVEGQALRFDAPLPSSKGPALYEVSIWAKLAKANDFRMVSLRTIRVR
jgi:uncharacterized protein YkwD